MRRLDIIYEATASDFAKFSHRYSNDSQILFSALVVAEDHRAKSHKGIDWISIFRVILLFPFTRRLKGISTIEQQYVRTVIRRKGNLWFCKMLELRDARMLATRFPKEVIWGAYLSRAYYGANMLGYHQARHQFSHPSEIMSFKLAAEIVACLKYPRPRTPNPAWIEKHQNRVFHILKLLHK